MARIFGNTNRDNAVKYFEIRPDESNIVLRGAEDEATSALLKGTVVLCLAEPLRIQGVRLRFTGEKRIGWLQSGSGPTPNKNHEEFIRRTWELKSGPQTLPKGNYEWPFDMIIPGDTHESLEGMLDTWVVYRMKATIERNVLQTNIQARKQIRIIRTPNTTDLELFHAMSVDNVWAKKIDYSLSVASKAVIFGSIIKVDFKLIPLLKGLDVGRITTQLIQKHGFSLRTSRNTLRSHSHSTVVHTDEHHLPENYETRDIDGQEGIVLSRPIPIPQSLRRCVQDFQGLGIKIKHSLAFNVQLHNPDGHVSELHATLPVHIFLSPQLGITEDNNLVDGSEQRVALAASEMTDFTPPQYGDHVLDRLYDDIDPSGYATPGGPSGVCTPLDARSRSVSLENLAPLTQVGNCDINVNVLQNRLNNLDIAGPAGSHRTAIERAPPSASTQATAPTTPLPNGTPGGIYIEDRLLDEQASGELVSQRSSSEEGDGISPQHIEYSTEVLSKVPSYTTALRSNSRNPLNAGLPTYQAAVQTPSSLAHSHAREIRSNS